MNNEDIQKQLAKLRRDKKFLWMGIMFFVLVVVWILSSIFATAKTSSITPELRELAKSFVPRLESRVFEEITAKRAFSNEELSYFSIYIFDKKRIDGESALIDIIAPAQEQEALIGSNNEVETSSTSTELRNDPEASQSGQEEVESSSSAEPANQDSGYMPIPIEAIIGPQN